MWQLFVVIWGKRACHVPCICVCVCVKGVGDVASSCRGDRGDACLKACGLGQLPPHRHTLPPLLLKHPTLLANPLLFPLTSTLLSSTHPHPATHTHTQATEEGRTPNAISTPLSTFVLMNRGGLVGHWATCGRSRAAGSLNRQAAEVTS